MSLSHVDEKSKQPLLPVAAGEAIQPNAVQPTQIRRRSRFRRVLAFSLAGVALFFLTHGSRLHSETLIRSKSTSTHHGEHAWAFDAYIGHLPERGHAPLHGRKAEEVFLTVPNPASAIAASRQYATTPHLAGSEGDLRTAHDFLALLQEQLGIDPPSEPPIFPAGSDASRNATLSINKLSQPAAWIDVYYPVQNTPLDHSLEILADDSSVVWAADLEEQSDGTDQDATEFRTAVPAWHGLSKDGEATGKLIYANYGRKADYDALVAQGVNFNGTIVLVRYGGVFRGLKIKGAEELGAVGVLIYSDPRDDGSVTEANGYIPYPHGPARNPSSVERGSVQYLSIYPGDPTTPGYPAYENATRTDGLNIPSIPSLPISWANAKVLLDEIQGKSRAVRMVNHVDTKITPIWNPMGVIPGHIKDEVIVVGNHRDAWVMGAADPSSGTVSVHEVVRGFGYLLRAGWKPLRTIVFASWDAEEYGLIGSTEWGEDFAEWIQQNVVAYLNLDVSVAGSQFDVAGSPSLSHFLKETAQAVPHPTDPDRTLWDARNDVGPLFGAHVDTEALAMHEEAKVVSDEVGVSPLGSGSDFTVFLQRLGIASLTSGFGGTLSDPVYHYHSIFDSERWQELYADPGFVKHVAIAQYLGLQTIRLADSVVLPLNTTHYAFQLEDYLNTVEDLAEASALTVNFAPLRASIKELQFASIKLDHRKAHAEHRMRMILRRLAWWRHHHPGGFKGKLLKVWHKCKMMLGFKYRGKHFPQHGTDRHEYHDKHVETAKQTAPHRAHGCNVKHAAHKNSTWPRLPHPHFPWSPKKALIRAAKEVRAVNAKLTKFEQGFIHEAGIKDREWYRHLGVAPGKWLGYGATTLPGLTESITIERNATLAAYEVKRLRDAIDRVAELLKA
ncbi:Zn-dependent exopeptidase [Vararia minispora EC-137]|uniref:Zn-dependent exopeptidase n=1 Tax=Vararia minispora EC-137 TaxID=1314806 RepID=A0ACB8QY84_9AGAM|nr:Zn-dependent exopeptidase [Vararia minispora EC-137]